MKAKDPNYEQRVRDSFAKQQLMRTIGAEMTDVEPGVDGECCRFAVRRIGNVAASATTASVAAG